MKQLTALKPRWWRLGILVQTRWTALTGDDLDFIQGMPCRLRERLRARYPDHTFDVDHEFALLVTQDGDDDGARAWMRSHVSRAHDIPMGHL